MALEDESPLEVDMAELRYVEGTWGGWAGIAPLADTPRTLPIPLCPLTSGSPIVDGGPSEGAVHVSEGS